MVITTPDKKLLLDFYNSNCRFRITTGEIEKNPSLLWAVHCLYQGLCPIPLKLGEKPGISVVGRVDEEIASRNW
jgi:hypothetical protein